MAVCPFNEDLSRSRLPHGGPCTYGDAASGSRVADDMTLGWTLIAIRPLSVEVGGTFLMAAAAPVLSLMKHIRLERFPVVGHGSCLHLA